MITIKCPSCGTLSLHKVSLDFYHEEIEVGFDCFECGDSFTATYMLDTIESAAV